MNMYDSDLQKFMMYRLAFERGIVPLEPDAGDVNRVLRDTSPQEARAAKRKFRKLWRKISRGGYKPASHYAESMIPYMDRNKWCRKMGTWATLYWESADLIEKMRIESVNRGEDVVE